jgi:hypothetical protein
MKCQSIAIVLATGMTVFCTGATAQAIEEQPWERFAVSVGGFAFASDTEIRLDSSTGIGTVVDVEDSLGLDSQLGTFRIGLAYRPGNSRRHQVELQYFDSSRDGNKTLTEDIQIGDNFFPAGTNVRSEFDLRFINVDYAYAFLQDDRVRLSGSIGLHVTDVHLKIDSSELSISEDESFTAPLPVIGIRAEMILTSNWRFKTRLDLLYIEYQGFAGVLSDAYVGVEYLPFRNFGFGLGFNGIRYRVEGDGGDTADLDLKGELQLDLDGILFYGKYYF